MDVGWRIGRQTHSARYRFLNDQEISDGGNFILGEKDSVYRLDIGSVDSDLVGKVKVTAENENGKLMREEAQRRGGGRGRRG